jgi:hypothetical protein
MNMLSHMINALGQMPSPIHISPSKWALTHVVRPFTSHVHDNLHFLTIMFPAMPVSHITCVYFFNLWISFSSHCLDAIIIAMITAGWGKSESRPHRIVIMMAFPVCPTSAA